MSLLCPVCNQIENNVIQCYLPFWPVKLNEFQVSNFNMTIYFGFTHFIHSMTFYNIITSMAHHIMLLLFACF